MRLLKRADSWIWFACVMAAAILWSGQPDRALAADIGYKVAVWGIPAALLLWRRGVDCKFRLRELLRGSFPWLSAVIWLCITAAFLWTVRLATDRSNTHTLFQWGLVEVSVTAGVVEEVAFRGWLFNRQCAQMGPIPAAIVNGVLFFLYHYPGLLLGQVALGDISPLRVGTILVMGIVFCLMLYRRRSLWLNMLVHTVWDILAYLFAVA